MKKLSLLSGAIALLSIASQISATTVIAPTFAQLVNEAEVIFQGTVTASRSVWVGEGAQRDIMTYVTFKVDDAVKGTPGSMYTISMVGGTVGQDTMEISGAPRFKIGSRDLLFVQHNGQQFIPLVGIMHGRFRVQQDQSGRDVVMTDDKAPLSSTEELGLNEQNARAGAPMSVDQFKNAVRETIKQSASHPTQ